MSEKNKVQTTFSDEEFSRLPEEGTFGGAAPTDSGKPEPAKGLLGMIPGATVTHPNGPPGGWGQAVLNEITKPIDPETQWMAGVAAAATPAGIAEAILPYLKQIPKAAYGAAKKMAPYAAGALGGDAISRAIRGRE